MDALAEVSFMVDDHDVRLLLSRVEKALAPVSLGVFIQQKVIPYIQGRAVQRFASEGDDVSGAWVPLAQSTQDIRTHLGYGAAGPINIREGDLFDYVTKGDASLLLGGDAVTALYPSVDPAGLTGKKFATAQRGTTGAYGTPARPVLGVGALDLAMTLETLGIYFAMAGMGSFG